MTTASAVKLPQSPKRYAIGIHGFCFTRPIDLGVGFSLLPLYGDPHEVNRLADSRHTFHLTGWAEFPMAPGIWHKELPLRLSAALTFTQQRAVSSAAVRPIHEDDVSGPAWARQRFTGEFDAGFERQSAGPIVLEDHFSATSRGELVRRLLSALADDGFKARGFHAALYRLYEGLWLRKQLLEVRYFLAFSGLEILARRAGGRGDDEKVILELGARLGLPLDQDEVAPWTTCRDALFHNGELRRGSHDAGRSLVRLEAYLTYALMKLVKFDDGYVNWEGWKDLQPFRERDPTASAAETS